MLYSMLPRLLEPTATYTLPLKPRSHLRVRLSHACAATRAACGYEHTLLSLCPCQELVHECINLHFRVSRMNNDADSRLLYNRIGHRRDRVSPLQEILPQSCRMGRKHWNDRGAQATLRDGERGIGVA